MSLTLEARHEDAGSRSDPLSSRLLRLYAGLAGFGLSLALMVQARLGLGPWDVLHQGLARRTGLDLGSVVIAVGALVFLMWLPLRQRPGIGTLSNVVLVGLVVDVALALLPAPRPLVWRIMLLAVGIGLNAASTGLYIGAGLGPGPRDGLMTGLARGRRSIRTVRLTIELCVLGAGIILGGDVGLGTLAYALAIGPLVQVSLRRFSP